MYVSFHCNISNIKVYILTYGSGYSLLHRNFLRIFLGKQHNILSNNGIRYFGSMSSILLAPKTKITLIEIKMKISRDDKKYNFTCT